MTSLKGAVIILFLSTLLFSQNTNTGGNVKFGGNVSIGGIGSQIVLVAVQISPTNVVIPFNQSQTFTAQGVYSNGSSADITALATWTSSNNTIASPQGTPPGNNLYQCNNRGSVIVTATYQSIAGNTNLSCQSPTFTPTGSINTTQSNVPVTIVQFTGSNGTSPFTFSSGDLPGFLSLSNTGCPGTQVNCSLVGTPNTVGVYSFHVQATDGLSNTACANPGCQIILNVVAAAAEDNTYCNSSNVVIGLTQDGPALPLAHCYNTAIANTPTTAGSIIYMCPQAQVGVPQCALTTIGANPNADVCYTTGGVWCPSLQSVINYIYNGGGTPRCWDVQIYPTNDNTPTGTPNRYVAPLVVAPGDIQCGPSFGRNYVYFRTTLFASLPPLGNRVTPSWLNVASIPSYKPYAQTSQYGVASGYYLATLVAEMTAGGVCSVIDSAQGALIYGTRFMGVAFTCVHGRDTSTDIWGGHVCPSDLNGSWNCYPGAFGEALVNFGCDILNNVPCVDKGGAYNIFDRTIFSGCDDFTQDTCSGTMSNLYVGSGGDYQAIIDSYLYGAVCLYAIGPCVEAHAISGANLPAAKDDVVFKVVNSFLSASGVGLFQGGGGSVSGFFPTDREFRRNNFFKPMSWKVDSTDFVGKIQDAFINAQNGANQGKATRTGTTLTWVSGNKFNAGMQGNQISFNGNTYTVSVFVNGTTLTLGSGVGNETTHNYVYPASNAYAAGTTCSIDPPSNGTTATCNVTVVEGLIQDVTISNKGSGYGLYDKANGNTAAANPKFYFTDGVSGITYISCANQPAGEISTVGTAVTWVHGNKFIPGMVGTFIAIGPTNFTPPNTCDAVTPNCYKVDAFIDKTHLTLHTSAGNLTNYDYQGYLPLNNDCVKPMMRFYNVKNHHELKHNVRALIEGNVLEQVWTGQSDQDGFCMLLTPKNANNNCPTCKVTDVTVRYNVCRGSNKGMQLSSVVATQGETFSQGIQRLSIHDNIFDGMNGYYWTTGTSPIQSSSMNAFNISNSNSDGFQPQDWRVAHNTSVGTLQAGFTANQSGFINIVYGCQYNKNGNSPTIWPGMVFQDNLSYGGVRNSALKNNGCIQCVNAACTDQAGHGPSETALRQIWTNDFNLPKSGSTYAGNQVTGLNIISGGACTVAPTTCTLSDPPSGHADAATCSITTTGVSPNISIKTAFPVFPGAHYTAGAPSPTISFNGTCPTPPQVNVYAAGAGNNITKSGCYSNNGMVLQAWPSITAMSPYPTHQLDPANNTCDNNLGGGNITVNTWTDVKFVNFASEGGAGAVECNGINCATGDLHLQGGSPFHNAAHDGTDLGANVDLILGTTTGTPSPYTGCFITAGSYSCP